MPKDYDKIHYNNIDVYARKVAAIYDSATKEGASIAMLVSSFNSDKPFSFADYPITKDRIDKLTKSLTANIEKVVLNGIDHEWTLSNNKNSELSRRVFEDNIDNLTEEQRERYFSNNHNARDAFKKRKTGGLGLSDRAWNYTNQFKAEIEIGIDFGLRDRLSAGDMARDLKRYLQDPDRYYRRFRYKSGEDSKGNPIYSKKWKRRTYDEATGKYKWVDEDIMAYNPGQGVYRSSARNAQRLARTEINMAYRASDHERWQQFDFVIGIEVRRSNNHGFKCPMCDSLAGKYPKDFKFSGWHPQCRCHAISILKTPEELQNNLPSANEVKTTPKGFDNWVDENKGRFGSKNTPYFIKDNFVDGKTSKGLNLSANTLSREINTLIGKAKDSGGFVQDIAESIAMKNNSIVTPINFKSKASIERKILSDKSDVSGVKDAVRTTIVAPKENIESILTELQKDKHFIRLKRQASNEYMGYSGNIVNVKAPNGIVAEIQVNTDKMIYAKESPDIARSIIGSKRHREIELEIGKESGLGHKYYEDWRILDAESTKAKSIALKMQEYYSLFQ